MKKAKVSVANTGSIANTLLEDGDRESDHAYGGNVEVVEVLVQKPSPQKNPSKVVATTIKPRFRFKKARM